MEAHVEMVFGRLDTNGDGVITVEEFIENCQSVSDTIFPIIFRAEYKPRGYYLEL